MMAAVTSGIWVIDYSLLTSVIVQVTISRTALIRTIARFGIKVSVALRVFEHS
jgi:hypothetical protein